MDIGRAIREIATSKGMKQADLCALTGVSDGYMSLLWNSRIEDPKASSIVKTTKALGVSYDALFELADKYEFPKKDK